MVSQTSKCWFPALIRSVLTGLCLIWMFLRPVSAKAGEMQTHYLNFSSFRVPFNFPDPNQRASISSVVLYVSDDMGRSYHVVKSASPTETYFAFQAPRQGSYLFVVQARYKDGKISIADPGQNPGAAQPELRIIVDTTPPQVTLRQMQSSGNDSLAIDWNILDDNPNPRSLQIDYKPSNGNTWTQLNPPLTFLGQTSWTPREGSGQYDVRLRVSDLAKNLTERIIHVAPGNVLPQGNNQDSGIGRPVILNTKNLKLAYEEVEVGKIELAEIKVYALSQEEKRWEELKSFLPPFPADHKLPVEVKREGTWGFKITMKNSAHKGEGPPVNGTQPDLWVTVDVTKPAVAITDTKLSGTVQNTQMTIGWTATDKNLAERPISLFYANSQVTPANWIPLAQGLPNDKSYLWNLPPEIPPSVLIKVEAVDLANNVGMATTTQPVITDLSTPKARINAVEGGAPTGSPVGPDGGAAANPVPNKLDPEVAKVRNVEADTAAPPQPQPLVSPMMEQPAVSPQPNLTAQPTPVTPMGPITPMSPIASPIVPPAPLPTGPSAKPSGTPGTPSPGAGPKS